MCVCFFFHASHDVVKIVRSPLQHEHARTDMAEFVFNFCVGEDVKDGGVTEREEVSKPLPEGRPCTSNSAVSNQVVDSEEIPITPFHSLLMNHVTPSRFQISDLLEILYVDVASVEKVAKNETQRSDFGKKPGTPEIGFASLLELSNSFHSDLIPGVYEGGLKIWECAFDLVEYLATSEIQFSGKSVLELGCGAGLPAIYALMKGAREVHFHDYNPEVINYVTIPSVLFNMKLLKSHHSDPMTLPQCKFYSGDWSSLIRLIPSGHYDVILTSETIYSLTSQPKLLAALKHLLCSKKAGVAYVAAKSYYFGVGGSVGSFVKLVKQDGYFNIEKCHIVNCEVAREILIMKPQL